MLLGPEKEVSDTRYRQGPRSPLPLPAHMKDLGVKKSPIFEGDSYLAE